ncbi:Ig-like protein group 3 [Archangium gephyra]|uniref:Ig-like protein group 3 n=1 Tax=Archangium gephyra TaxID=48 RepID=A0AAC8TF96_9BACT|nr:Ig-like domain-containing protein [Archangium gephyra]AKJ03808.1 serine protease, subtilase family [Archangium gephyra]REG23587.1 Ig-like protein group 3 [Archangium gephyra]
MRTLVTLLAAGLVLASCEFPPTAPTKTPEPAADPGVGALAQPLEEPGNATFEPLWGAPACTAPGSRCDSGELLKGRGSVGPEPQQPNTVGGSCADGSEGTSGIGPSLERLAVTRADGTPFAVGKEVTVQATVIATSTYWKQVLDLYAAPDVSNPTWTLVASLDPQQSGTQILSATYLLPAGSGLQVLRGVFRMSDGIASAACVPGSTHDHDDLVFAVGTEPDVTPPAVAITYPAQGATVRNTVNVRVNASDDFGVQRVELYAGSTLIATGSQSPFSLSWATRTVPNGPYTLTVRAYDAAGHGTTSAPLNVVVDNDFVPPELSVLTPVEGATVSQTVSISGLVNDDRGVTSVRVEIGPPDCDENACAIEDLYHSASEPFTGYQLDWNTRSRANGPRVLRVTAYDIGGNASPTVTVNVIVDNDRTPPVTAITAPTSGSVLGGLVSVEASASDDRSLASVAFYVDGHLIQKDTAAPYAIAWDSSSMANGGHTLHTVATDGSGNQTKSASVTVETNNPGADTSYDAVLGAPRCGSVQSSCDSRHLLRGRSEYGLEPNPPNTLDSCVDGFIYSSTYNEAVERIRVFRPDGTVLASGKRVRIEADVWVSQAAFDTLHLYYKADAAQGGWTRLTSSPLKPPAGTSNQSLVTLSAEYVLPAGALQAVRAEFGFGEGFGTCNERSPWASVNDRDDLIFPVSQEPDTLPPEVAITSPAHGATVSGPIPLTVAVSDDFDVAAVELYDGATRLARNVQAPFSMYWNTWSVPVGNHTLTAKAYDAAGNLGTSAPVTVTVAPESVPPTVSLTAPAHGATLTGTVSISANATDNESGMSQVEFFLDGVLLKTDTSWPYSSVWDTRTAASGSHTLTARATDRHGNTATASVEVTVDNVGPAVALTSPASGATVNGVVSLQASATDGAGVSRVEFLVDGVLLGSDTTAPYSVDWDTGWTVNGSHTLQARAHDTLNQVSTSAQLTVTTLQPGSAVYDSVLGVPRCATLNTVCDTTTLVKGRWADEPSAPNTISSNCQDGSASAFEANSQKINRIKVSSLDGATFAQGGRVRIDVHVNVFDTATDALDLFYANEARTPSWTYLTTLRPAATGAQLLSAEYVLPAGFLQAVRAQFRAGGGSSSACSTGSYDERDDVAFAVNGDPLVTLTAPSSGALVQGLVSLTATASSASPMNRLEFYVDGTLIGSDTTAPYALSWDSATVADGPHTLLAKAHDTGGRVGTSAAVVVNTDTTPPEVALTSPVQGSYLQYSVVLEATVSDSGGVAKVEFYRGTTLLGTDTTAPYSMTWSTTSVADGAHTFSVKAQDRLGNASTSPGVEVIIDKTSPSEPVITAPASYALVRGTVQVSVTTTDNLGVARVEFHAGTTRLGTDTSAPYEVSWDTSTLADGTYSLSATAYDHAGNGRSSGLIIPVTTDNTPPAAALTAPAPGTFLRGSVTLEATASDAKGVTKVEFYRGTALIGTATTAPYSMTWNTSSVADGTQTLWVKAHDKAGNVRTSSEVAVTVDNTAPVTAVSAPAQGALLRGTVPVSATASDAVGVERVEFFAGTTLFGTATTAPYVVSWETTAGAQGGITLTTKAYDAAGHVSVSAGRTVTVDNVAPTVAITSPANGTSFSFLTFSTTLQASASDNVGVTQVVFYDGATVIGTDTSAPYSVTWSLGGVPKGTHTLTAKAHDAAGNVTASAPISVKVN